MTATTQTLSRSAWSRPRFALHYALRHLLLSAAVVLVAAWAVFGLLYPYPYREMLGVGSIFVLLLVADVVCGPLLTLVLASPAKSRRERWLDFGLVGLIQVAALVYGLHSVWLGRPAVLAFEYDRLVVVSANEVEGDALERAPAGLRSLPRVGVLQVGTRRPVGSEELMQSMELGLSGVALAQLPHWWMPMEQVRQDMAGRARPLNELMARVSAPDAATLQRAVRDSGVAQEQLRYLPLTSSKTREWVALLDEQMKLRAHAPVDGF